MHVKYSVKICYIFQGINSYILPIAISTGTAIFESCTIEAAIGIRKKRVIFGKCLSLETNKFLLVQGVPKKRLPFEINLML